MYHMVKKSTDQIFEELICMFAFKKIIKALICIFFGLAFVVAVVLYTLSKEKVNINDSNIILIDGQRYLKLDKD